MFTGALAVFPGLTWGRTATACAVCLSGTDETRAAYYTTTALLIVLPLALFAAALYWLRRAARRSSGGASQPTPDPAQTEKLWNVGAPHGRSL